MMGGWAEVMVSCDLKTVVSVRDSVRTSGLDPDVEFIGVLVEEEQGAVVDA